MTDPITPSPRNENSLSRLVAFCAHGPITLRETGRDFVLCTPAGASTFGDERREVLAYEAAVRAVEREIAAQRPAPRTRGLR